MIAVTPPNTAMGTHPYSNMAPTSGVVGHILYGRHLFGIELAQVRLAGDPPVAFAREACVLEPLKDLPLGPSTRVRLGHVPAQEAQVDTNPQPLHVPRLQDHEKLTIRGRRRRLYKTGTSVLGRAAALSTETLWRMRHPIRS